MYIIVVKPDFFPPADFFFAAGFLLTADFLLTAAFFFFAILFSLSKKVLDCFGYSDFNPSNAGVKPFRNLYKFIF